MYHGLSQTAKLNQAIVGMATTTVASVASHTAKKWPGASRGTPAGCTVLFRHHTAQTRCSATAATTSHKVIDGHVKIPPTAHHRNPGTKE